MIEWREAMSVGHPVIDADHKKIIGLINLFEERGAVAADEVLLELVEYTKNHFAREERVQSACRFPFLSAHRKAHERLVHDLTDLLARWESASRAEQPERLAEIGQFLRLWLVGHILKEDRQMKPFTMKASRTESSK